MLPRIVRYISVPIETLRPGDYVLARDENSPEEELVLRQVEERFERTAYVLLHLTLQDASGRRQTLQTTAEHPVYKLGEGWVAAGEVAAGDRSTSVGGCRAATCWLVSRGLAVGDLQSFVVDFPCRGVTLQTYT